MSKLGLKLHYAKNGEPVCGRKRKQCIQYTENEILFYADNNPCKACSKVLNDSWTPVKENRHER